ncbi:4138_t:CDS:2, partial [Entrophospora sp. SA101]
MEEVIFTNPQKIADQTKEIIIFDGQIQYPDFSENEGKLVQGEKTPDIDLNFSGEYQKTAHDYVRELLGEEHVYRIGTINKLSQQTAEIFLREYKKLKKELNPKFNLYNNGDDEKLLEQLKGIKPNIFLKLDILGHDEPTVLQKLYELTKVNPDNISFHDEKIMEIFTQADTLGIPEFGTDFVKRNFLKSLKPTKFSQLVQISVDNKTAFLASEYIRKGKWNSLNSEIKKAIREKIGLADEDINNITKDLTVKQNNLIAKISQELAELEENSLIDLLRKINEKLEELGETG